MTDGEITAMLANLGNIELQLGEAAGPILCVEVLMRLLCQLCPTVKAEIKGGDYLNCKLGYVQKAIVKIFRGDQLQSGEAEKMKKLLLIRDKLFHGDFVNAMKFMGILSPSWETLPPKNKTKKEDELDIRQAINSIDRNRGLAEARKIAKQVKGIIEKLIRGLAKN